MWRTTRLQVEVMNMALLRRLGAVGRRRLQVREMKMELWDAMRRMRMGEMGRIGRDGSSCDFFEEDENGRDGKSRAGWELLRFFGSNRKNPNAYSHAPLDVSDGSRWNGWSDEATAPDFLCSRTA
ncbi:hypothetical protein ACLOJK_009493 [Asimina triloba]